MAGTLEMWLKAILLLLLALAAALGLARAAGAARWRAGTKALHARIEAARLPAGGEPYDPRQLEGLPAPVRRYFRAVLEGGQPLVAAVTLEHTGTFNMQEAGEQWRPFTSRQRVVVRRPGFVWDARIRMAPGLTACVHDAYAAGEGVLTASLFGLLTVMEQPPTPALAHGELMRFLAEAAWYPTALLPGHGVRWQPLDDTSARAWLTDAGTAVSLDFHFDEAGLIHTVRSPGRFRLVGGEQRVTPWQGRFWDYQHRDGMRIPLAGEVAWLLPEGPKPYWRGRVERVEYEAWP